MFNFLIKGGAFLFLWKKYKAKIISIIASILIIWLLFSIYDDLINTFQIVDTTTLLFLLLGKWTIVILTIFINIKLLKSSKDLDSIKEKKVVLPKKSQDVLDKKDILTTTDLILKKYTKKSEL